MRRGPRCDEEPALGQKPPLKRFFDIAMRRCPRCGGVQVKLIAAILERAVIGKILTHLGLDPQPPPRSKGKRPVDSSCSSPERV